MTIDFNTSFILPNGLDLGGVTTWSVELAERLAHGGRQATLVRHVDRYVSKNCILPSNVRLIDCAHHIHPNHWHLFKRDIEAYVNSYCQSLPSIIIPNYSFGSYAACACLSRASADKIRVIGMAHTDNAEYYRWLVQFESIIHKFVAVSREIASHLADRLPHRQQDIVLRPYGVTVCDKLSHHYSPPSQPVQLIYAGRLSERQKHISDLVKLAAGLDKNDVDFELKIYGTGRDQGYLEDLIRSLKQHVRNKIKLPGQVSPRAMASLYRAADIFVLVSEYEGTSISMLESMAQGCVPVVNKVSGTSDVIDEGNNGFTVPVGGVHEMVEKIIWLNQKRKRLSQLGAAAHATVRNRYSYEDYVPWFEDLLDTVWQEKPRPWQRQQPFSFYFPARQFLTEAGYTLAAKPGLRWLHRVKGAVLKRKSV